jgi:teichuronic acid biosynthesis glycosyltransferase TuaC
MSDLLLTFSNLFPSSVMPTHGLFVRERMQRVVARLGVDWRVVSPVPHVAWLLRNGQYRRWQQVPREEVIDGVTVHRPRYRHWPGLSTRRQADAMAEGALATVQALAQGRRVVVDAHYLWPDGVAAATIAARLGLSYVLTARGSDLNVLAQDRRIAERIAAAARGAAACFGVSTALCERFGQVAGLPRERVRLARNGVDLSRFRPGDRRQARRELGLPEDGIVLLGVGRLVPGKGFHVAVAGLQQLAANVRLVLVGDGPESPALRESGGRRLVLLGAQPPDRVALALQAADLLVLPSEREGWPNVVTEALASGVRCVATAVGGIPEILQLAPEPGAFDAGRGALVAQNDPAGLAAAVQRLLAAPVDPAVVREFAGRYSWDEPVDQLASTFSAAFGPKEAA